MTTQRERVTGYLDALQDAGLHPNDALIFDSAPTRNGGMEAAIRALADPRRPTAAFCFNDIVAIGVTRALNLRGLRAGVDFAVIGFDDVIGAEHNLPPLTTVSADTRLMGARAARGHARSMTASSANLTGRAALPPGSIGLDLDLLHPLDRLGEARLVGAHRQAHEALALRAEAGRRRGHDARLG